MQQLEPLSGQLSVKKRYACYVATRPVEADDEARLDRIDAEEEDDRNCRSRRLGSECRRRAVGDNHAYPPTNQIGRQIRQSIDLALRPAVFDGDVLAVEITHFVEALPESRQTARDVVGLGRSGAEIADHRHRLLRASATRSCDYGSRDQGNEAAPPHSITSSARASSNCGIVNPSV
jgi:hypothetical protein